MSAHTNRWDDARKKARASGDIERVMNAMKVDFPSGTEGVRHALAEDFVIRYILFGGVLSVVHT